jgi:hypothetical protein
MSRLGITLAMVLAMTAPAAAGPFGIEMGDGVPAENIESATGSGLFILRSVARPHPDFTRYSVRWSEGTGVCAIGAYSDYYSPDELYTNVSYAFDRVSGQLSNIHGHSFPPPAEVSIGTVQERWWYPAQNNRDHIRAIGLSIDRKKSGYQLYLYYALENAKACDTPEPGADAL